MTRAAATWDPEPVPRSAILPLARLAAREVAIAAPLKWLLPRRFPAWVTAAALIPQHIGQIVAARRTGVAYTDSQRRSLLLATPHQVAPWRASLLPLLAPGILLAAVSLLLPPGSPVAIAATALLLPTVPWAAAVLAVVAAVLVRPGRWAPCTRAW